MSQDQRSTLPDRIRAAAQAAADTVPPGSSPPLRPPAGIRLERHDRTWPDSATRARWTRRLGPLAAAAAVAVIAIAASALTVSRPQARPGPGTPSGSGAAAALVASGRIPPYYVSLGTGLLSATATVRATASSDVLATIRSPVPGADFVAAAGAADDRAFVLDVAPAADKKGVNPDFSGRTFYLLRLAAGGEPAGLTRLGVSAPRGEAVLGLALSPDGDDLALALQLARGRAEIRVYTLATGAVRTWSATGSFSSSYDDSASLDSQGAASLSWAASEKSLAFQWIGNATNYPPQGVWLLNLTQAGHGLIRDSREIVSWATQPPRGSSTMGCEQDTLLTPDGSALICGEIAADPPRSLETEFAEYSTATGRVTRVIGRLIFSPAKAWAVDVLWSNASGSVLIGVVPKGMGQLGVISGNTFTPLPMPPSAGQGAAESGYW
jgi:hypothetical protein